METIRDRATLGALAGVAAILTRDVYSFLAKQIGFAKFYVWGIAADLFVSGKAVHTFLGSVLGILADMGTGALLGVLFVYFLRWTGGKNALIKGVGLGIGAWLLLFGIMFHTLPHTAGAAPKDVLSNLSGLVGHVIFGFALGYFTNKLLPLLGSDHADTD